MKRKRTKTTELYCEIREWESLPLVRLLRMLEPQPWFAGCRVEFNVNRKQFDAAWKTADMHGQSWAWFFPPNYYGQTSMRIVGYWPADTDGDRKAYVVTVRWRPQSGRLAIRLAAPQGGKSRTTNSYERAVEIVHEACAEGVAAARAYLERKQAERERAQALVVARREDLAALQEVISSIRSIPGFKHCGDMACGGGRYRVEFRRAWDQDEPLYEVQQIDALLTRDELFELLRLVCGNARALAAKLRKET